ncbi:XkdQ/YqbQ family protein [Anaerocolumna sp. MB42-C2]|uniref:XkdQ/YqbQ family protein n=1 Tax=Anaerocolumna sp. MB42-C2 TaxID=3070997 RepID=UPI0027E078AF|nr:hypothetical protein [Anaerocolumna sp. MB42-C2]WMJ90625.1 hypothetical protein RBU59_14145 [Anaerocolumna sp. MB42-C2]
MMQFLVNVDHKFYEISELVTKISYEDNLNDGCSKLEFSYINKDLDIKNGSNVRFTYNETNIFQGFVFKISRSKGNEISVTAYDQLRYCKAKDTLVLKGDTVATIVNKMCNYFKLQKGHITDTKYILSTGVQEDKTWLDIIYSAISDTLLNKGKWYVLRDEFGSIALREIRELDTDLILGDYSLCYDYKFDKSIDDEFYNMIKLVSKDEETKKADVTLIKDDTSIGKYGALQYYEDIDKKYNAAQVKEKADNLLKLYNREKETISLDCLGDTRIRAGSTFYCYIKDINYNNRLIVKSVSHDFLPNHTMSLEVMNDTGN